MSDRGDWCGGPECERPAERDGLCAGHRKQKQRGGPLRPLEERTSIEERVLEAGSDWLEAESDQDFATSRARFLRSAEAWMRARGWRPPKPGKSPASSKLTAIQLALAFSGRRARGATCGRRGRVGRRSQR